MLMFNQLCDHFELHHLLVLAQFGFTKGKSTTQAVESLVNVILDSFEILQLLFEICHVSLILYHMRFCYQNLVSMA